MPSPSLNPFGSDDDATPPAGTVADGSAAFHGYQCRHGAPDLSNLPARPARLRPPAPTAGCHPVAGGLTGPRPCYSADALRAGTEAVRRTARRHGSGAAHGPGLRMRRHPPTIQPPSALRMRHPSAQAPAPARTHGCTAAHQCALCRSQPGNRRGSHLPAARCQYGLLPAIAVFFCSPFRRARSPRYRPIPPYGAGATVHGDGQPDHVRCGPWASGRLRTPPLDPSINQWVAAPIRGPLSPDRFERRYFHGLQCRRAVQGHGRCPTCRARSSPIWARFPPVPTGSIAAMNGGVAPTAVVYFPGDGTTLVGRGPQPDSHRPWPNTRRAGGTMPRSA